MQSIPRRAAVLVVSGALLALTGCGGAGYGDPIAATEGDAATVALAPAPVTTPTADAGRAPASPGAQAAPSGRPATDEDDGSGTRADGRGREDAGTAAGSTAADELAAYAADANRFCRGFKDATRNLTREFAAADPSNPGGLGRSIVVYGEAITAAARGIRAAPVPPAASAYHARTVRWVDGMTTAISANRSGLLSGDAGAATRVVQRVKVLGQPPLGSAVPASLRGRAGACAS